MLSTFSSSSDAETADANKDSKKNMTCDPVLPVLEIGFCPPTVESKNHKNYVNFDLSDLFLGLMVAP